MATSPPRAAPRQPAEPAPPHIHPAPPCCRDGGAPGPTASFRELVERMALFEAQSLAAARDIRCLYRAERARTAELEQVRAQMLAYADDLRNAFTAERARRAELERQSFEAVRALALAIDARDPYTGGHVERVSTYALALAEALGRGRQEVRAVEVGALLHDIGKIGVPDAILNKNGPLDEAEWAQMRRHPAIGAQMLGGLALLEPALPAVLHHHERYDGRGYPAGLAAEQIPALARVVAIADAFDAMLTDRPYRQGLPLEVALRELERCAGTQFDPHFTPAFVRLVRTGRLEVLQARATAA